MLLSFTTEESLLSESTEFRRVGSLTMVPRLESCLFKEHLDSFLLKLKRLGMLDFFKF